MMQYYNKIRKVFTKEEINTTKSTGPRSINGNSCRLIYNTTNTTSVNDTLSSGRDGRSWIMSLKNILIIDDESDMTSVLKTRLEISINIIQCDQRSDLAISNYKSGEYIS
jgi:hypothetical protein